MGELKLPPIKLNIQETIFNYVCAVTIKEEKNEKKDEIKEEKKEKKELKKYLSSGTYGKIYSISDTTVMKTQSMFENSDTFNTVPLREICALSQFSHPNMIKVEKIEQSSQYKSKINIYMEKCQSLYDWIYSRERSQIISSLPKIVSQLIDLLYYFEKINKIHGDLSLNNITMDKNDNVKVIDYGTFTFCPSMMRENLCTYVFCAPENQRIKIKNGEERTTFKTSCKQDIFSLGMLIKYILLNKYDSEAMIKQYEIEKKDEYESNYLSVLGIVHVDFILLWRQMLKIDPKNRISASSLYKSPYFKKIRNSYEKNSTNEIITNIVNLTFKNQQELIKFKDIKFTDINVKMRKILVHWLYEVADTYHIKQCFGLTIHILDIYLSKNPDLKKKSLQCLGCVCLCISEGLLTGIDTSLNTYKYISDNSITIDDLKTMIIDVLVKLNYNLYYHTFDQELYQLNKEKGEIKGEEKSEIKGEEKSEIKGEENKDILNYDIILYIYHNHNNSGKSNKNLITLYNKLLNEKTVSDWMIEYNFAESDKNEYKYKKRKESDTKEGDNEKTNITIV